jgi:glycosyltransferase involved in cell wall biosynthesis
MEKRIMRILQVNVVYKSGSTGKIVYDIHSQLLRDGHESIVCYGRGRPLDEASVYKISPEWEGKLQAFYSRISGYAYTGSVYSTYKLIKNIENMKPDIVHLHCLNGNFLNIYKILNYLKLHNIKTVLTLHAEFMYTAGCGYSLECEKWKTGCGGCPQLKDGRPLSWFFDRTAKEWHLMKNAFRGFDNITIVPVSQWLCDRAKQSPFLKEKQFVVIGNGIDTLRIFRPTNYSDLKIKHGLNKEKIILHVTQSFANSIKGGKYIIELAKKLRNDKIKIIIVGYDCYGIELPLNIIPIKYTQNQKELAQYYSMADVTVLTSKKETYSMICAESLSCGTPVVGFKAGAPELISLKEYSEFVEYGDTDSLEKAIKYWMNKKSKIKEMLSSISKAYYSKETMYKKYLKIYSKVLNN